MKKYYKKRYNFIFIILATLVVVTFFVSLFIGSSNISFKEALLALFGNGANNNIIIMQNIRLPRVIAALVVGASLSLAGLIMQTTLGNEIASPQTLGVTNAATFGANLAIIVFSGGFLITGNNIHNYFNNVDVFSSSITAFIFSMGSIFLILGICKIRNLSRETIILSGVALGAVWSAFTSLLQYYSSDISLSAAVVWSFGDLSRTSYKVDLIISIVLVISSIYYITQHNKLNGLLLGDDLARTSGVKVNTLRVVSLILASLLIACCVANLGIISFVGIICPHIAKRIFGYNHKYTVPASIMIGSILLILSDSIARVIGNGSQVPVGILTAIIGAPFFLYIVFSRRRITHD